MLSVKNKYNAIYVTRIALGCFLALFFISGEAFGQRTADFPTEKQRRDSYLGLSLSTLVATDSLRNHQFVARASGYTLPGAKGQNGFALTGIINFNRLDLQLGYIGKINKNWWLGTNFFLSKKDRSDQLSGEFWVSHSSHIRKFLFWEKRIQFRADNTSRRNSTPKGQFLLRTGLGKRWALGTHGLTSLLSFTAGFDTHQSVGDTRTVDRTEWQLSLLWDNHPRFPVAFGLWAGQLTEYFFAIETTRYDAEGNLIDFRPDRKLNLRQLTFGFRLIFRPGGEPATEAAQVQAMQSLRPR